MPGFISFVRNQYADLPVPQAPANIGDGTYIVTGANSGLGFECTKHLFRMGAGRIILAVRSREKGEAALATIRSDTGRKDAGEVWQLDLASLDSVEAFAVLIGKLDRLDGLVANAGVAMGWFQTIDGIEESLQVNVVSTMLLTFRALPKLRESARKLGIQTHIVVVSSNTALEPNLERRMEKAQGDVFDALSSEKDFKGFVQYPTTKLLQIFAVRQLASLLPVSESGVIVNAVSPGACYSDLDRNAPFLPRLGITVMRKLVARTAEEGSRNLLQAAFAGPDSHGSYCSECQIKDNVLPAWITNDTGKGTQKHVWDDLLRRLNSSGHTVDIKTTTSGNGGEANIL